MTSRIPLIALAVAAVALAIPSIRHLREAPPPAAAPMALTLAPPAGAEFGSSADLVLDLALAPDGREMAFAATANGSVQLWRRAIDALEASAIPDTNGATLPTYSADGHTLWYFAGNRLRALDLRDGTRRDVLEAPNPGGAAVHRDGTVLVAATTGPIKRVANGGVADATTLRAGERSHTFPCVTGDGESFVYLATLADGRRTLRLRSADADVALTRSDSHAVVVAGLVAYVRDGALRAESLDPDVRRRVPNAATLATGVGVSAAGRGSFALSEKLLAWAPPVTRSAVLRWMTMEGRALPPVTEPGDFWQVRLSPDERAAAITARDPLMRTLDVFTIPTTSGHPARLTLALAADTDPVWSPDGRRIAFRSSQEGRPHIFAGQPFRAGKAAADEVLWRSPLDEVPTDWTGEGLVFHARSPETGFDIWRLPAGADAAVPIARTPFNEVDGRVSPDGRWLAFASDEPGHFDVYVSAADGAQRVRVSTGGGERPQWTAAGRQLVFRRGNNLMRAEVTATDTSLRSSLPAQLLALPGIRDFAVARDGTRLLAIVSEETAPPTVRTLVHWTVPDFRR